MDAERIAALRRELGCGARALGEAVGVDQATVLSWERGETFPTKQHADKLRAIEAEGLPSARPKGLAEALADPSFWCVVRKIAAHPRLFDEVTKLASRYDDPAERPRSAKGERG